MNMSIFIKKKSPPPPPPPRNSAAAGITWKGEVKMTFTIPARLWYILLCCLFLIGFLAVPVQSQSATATPTAPNRLLNPTSAQLGACGLPTTWAQWNASATVTTFNMTANCTFNSWDVGELVPGSGNIAAFLYFAGGLTYTINGNGYSIIGPDNSWAIYVQTAGTVLNLNNVTLQGSGGSDGSSIAVDNGATLNARSVTFRDSTSGGPCADRVPRSRRDRRRDDGHY